MRQNIKNFSYSILANGVVTLTNLITTLVMPKILDVESYGYFQLYMFYARYVGILHLGWADGIYLKYCGEEYEKLDRKLFNGQIKTFECLQIMWAFLAILNAFHQDILDKKIVFVSVGILIAITNIRILLSFILQATNRIQEYAKASIFGNFISVFLYVVLLAGKEKFYGFYVGVNLIGVMITLLLECYWCRELLIISKKDKLFHALSLQKRETVENISVGSKLMLASLAGMLILGIVRWAVEIQWDIEVFAQVSLTLSVSNLFMTFINAVATVLLPMLRQMDEEKAVSLYKKIDICLLIILSGGMLLYYPAYLLITHWIPHYQESLKYMAILFPVCIFEGKTSLLLTTYLKLIRREKKILLINILTVVVSVILTGISVFVFENLTLTVIAIVVILGARCVFAELYLGNCLCLNMWKSIVMEVSISICFMYSSWIIGGRQGVICYLCSFIIIIMFNIRQLKNFF